METKFYQSEANQPHPERTRAILKAHPEVRTLFTKNPYTALIMVGILVLQTGIAASMGYLGFKYIWLSFIIAYAVGAFANHCMYVIIHDATHNLVFTSAMANRWVAMLADLPNLFPGAMGFRVYHLKHHAHQGDHDYDADIAGHWEAKLIGNSFIGKAFWLMFFPFFQLTRPPRLKSINMWSVWTFVNLALCVAYDFSIIYFFGWPALVYLVFSFFLSIGLHPCGARWIQEHYTYDPNQETASYYGPVNIVALNVGYHNEHHDFPSIPWNNLPKLKAMAPEYYDNLKSYDSYVKLLCTFLTDRRYSLFSRVERIKDGKVSLEKAKRNAA
jgi:sphingolipid delta-4 desaturase